MIFVDSWAWIALADKDDLYHRKPKAQHKKLTRARQQYVTTDYVLSETITYLYDALRPAQAQGSLTRFWLLSTPALMCWFIFLPTSSAPPGDSGKNTKISPAFSFVDFTSMVVMQDLNIADVFTGDAHFRQVNLGFQLHP